VPPPSSEGKSGGGALGVLFMATLAGLRLLAAGDLDGWKRRRG
jgi:hypothetical protein